MTPEQQEFYEKLGDALEYMKDNDYEGIHELVAISSMQKLHNLWPTLCELDEWLGCKYDSEVKTVIKCARPFISKAVSGGGDE